MPDFMEIHEYSFAGLLALAAVGALAAKLQSRRADRNAESVRYWKARHDALKDLPPEVDRDDIRSAGFWRGKFEALATESSNHQHNLAREIYFLRHQINPLGAQATQDNFE